MNIAIARWVNTSFFCKVSVMYEGCIATIFTYNEFIETNYFRNRKEVKTMMIEQKEKGQGLVEYALILVLVAVVVIVILALLGPAIGNIFSSIVNGL
jgi:pilus assembly protein Flp/PilA